MNREWIILNQNIRGINDPKKWTTIAIKIEESQCTIICLQETKRATFDSAYVKNFFPKRVNKFEFLPSVGPSGGLLVARNDQVFSGQIYHINAFALSIQITSRHNEEHWILTNVYGPCEQQERLLFIHWLQNFQIRDDINWIILWDFNYSLRPGLLGLLASQACPFL